MFEDDLLTDKKYLLENYTFVLFHLLPLLLLVRGRRDLESNPSGGFELLSRETLHHVALSHDKVRSNRWFQ